MESGSVTRKCHSCGTAVAGDDIFCGECGAALAVAPRAQRSGVEPTSGSFGAEQTCPHCGREVAGDTTICLGCGYELGEVASGAELERVEATPGGRPMIPGSPIVLGEGERVWRRYAVMAYPQLRIFGITLNRAHGSGTLYVTDSRLLFYASLTQPRGRRSALVQETQLQHVTGLMAYVSRSWSWFGFIVVLLLALIGLSFFEAGHHLVGIVLFALAGVGVALLLQGLAFRGTIGVRVQSSASHASPIGFGELGNPRGGFLRALLGPFAMVIPALWGPRDAMDLLMALPARDAERVIVELGALIADLQAKGGLVQTHWGIEAGHGGY